MVRALNGLAAVETMESYLRYLHNIIATSRDNGSDGHMQPVYGIGLERRLEERIVPSLTGYRGMGPVRVGNQAHEHVQHDVYGNAILAGAQAFFDDRLLRQPDDADFDRFESVGERAFQMHDKPDAGMWELRSRSRIHTSSSLMCWAACDRLAKIAAHRGLEDRARLWQERSESVRGAILKNAWNEDFGAFAESFGGDALDAGLLLMAEVGFLEPADPRFQSTLERIESNLRRGNHLFRYTAPDDFGVPRSAFNICTFWYIDALARTGRVDEAREIFESMLACRNRLGLLSEDIDPETGGALGQLSADLLARRRHQLRHSPEPALAVEALIGAIAESSLASPSRIGAPADDDRAGSRRALLRDRVVSSASCRARPGGWFSRPAFRSRNLPTWGQPCAHGPRD